MKIYAQVLGTKTLDSDPSLLLFFDNKRYLFNAGEGSMRFCTEHKIRLSKINHVLLTELRPETIGGLPGLLLTMADSHSSSASQTHSTQLDVGICGPPNTLTYLSTLRWFVKRKDLLISLSEATNESESILSDENLSIDCVVSASQRKRLVNHQFYGNQFLSSFEKHCIGREASDEPALKKRRLDQSEHSSLFSYRDKLHIAVKDDIVNSIYGDRLEPTANDCAVSYICKTTDMPGKFDPGKAKQLGLKPGPNYGKLTKGESITLDDGTVITPEQVVGPVRPGPVIVVVSCPSLLFLDNLIHNSKWKEFTGPEKNVSLMFHISHPTVVEHASYLEFIKSFGPKCQHIMINEKYSEDRCVFHSFTNIQCKLNVIDNEIFGIPRATSRGVLTRKQGKQYTATLASDITAKLGKNFKVYRSENLMRFTLEPANQYGFDKDSACIPELNVEEIQKEFSKDNHPTLNTLIENYREAKNQTLQKLAQNQESTHEKIIMGMRADDLDFILLGTGAAVPSKYRNVSAILINQRENSILMDCGEGTLGQLYRVFGEDDCNDLVLNRLACVWLSHMHADHHLGLAKILTRKADLYFKSKTTEAPKKLLVVGPQLLLDYLQEYEQTCLCIDHETPLTLNSFYDFILIDTIIDPHHTHPVLHDRLYKPINGLAIKSFYNIAVDHSCKNSYGAIIEYSNGFKIVYSGDTRPCKALVEAGKDATVLIHEATFEDTLMIEAIKKKHSTTKEAVTVGMEMNAYRILLTHFSQRYPKVPVFDDEDLRGNHLQNRSSIGFDMMRLNARELPYFPAVIPAVQELFAEEIEQQSSDN